MILIFPRGEYSVLHFYKSLEISFGTTREARAPLSAPSLGGTYLMSL